MGNAASTNLAAVVDQLASGPVPETGDEKEDLFWNQMLPAKAVPSLAIFADLQPDNVRDILQKQPRNLALLLLRVSYHGYIVEDYGLKYEKSTVDG